MFEYCPHFRTRFHDENEHGGICIFAGKSQGATRCGAMTGILELRENDVEFFTSCAKENPPKQKGDKVIFSHIPKTTAVETKSKQKTKPNTKPNTKPGNKPSNKPSTKTKSTKTKNTKPQTGSLF